MEFLMTYGWAILVVLAAIAALAYFGVLSPDRFVPDKCMIQGEGLTCTESGARASDGVVSIGIANSGGRDVTINSIAVTATGGCPAGVGAINEVITTIADGNRVVANFTCGAGAADIGTKFRGDIVISFTPEDLTIPQSATGTITKRVT
jgi:hypothetical protein